MNTTPAVLLKYCNSFTGSHNRGVPFVISVGKDIYGT